MTVTLTTNHSSYNPGQIAKMTLTMTNTTNHDLKVGIGPSIDGFNIRHNGKLIWISNPQPQPEYIVLRTLARTVDCSDGELEGGGHDR